MQKRVIRIKSHYYNYVLIALIFAVPPVLMNIGEVDLSLALSFLSIDIVLALHLLVILSIDRKNVANIFVFIFFYLFFLIAPILQISDATATTLVNTLPVNYDQLAFANILTLIFLAVYLVGYLLFYRIPVNDTPKSELIDSRMVRALVLYSLFFISCFAVLLAIQDIRAKVLILEALERRAEDDSLSTGLLRNKVLYNIPLATYFYYTIAYKGEKKWWIVITLLVMIIITKNPMLERRNAIGAAYLTIIFIHLERFIKTSRQIFLFFFTTFVVFFPISSLLTHSRFYKSGINFDAVKRVIVNHFTELHYDAWANLTAGIDYVAQNGYTLGNQILGTLFFYVPRSIWPSKPYPSGFFIGDYLIEKHEMWFNNLSFPIHAEAYLDFGIPGVVVYGIMFSLLIAKLGVSMSYTSSYFKLVAIYLSISLMFILRGPLMATTAYTVGALVAIWVIPNVLITLFSLISWNVRLKPKI